MSTSVSTTNATQSSSATHSVMRRTLLSALLVIVLILPRSTTHALTGTTKGEWRSYGGDLGHTRYSPLALINAQNFNSSNWHGASRPTSGEPKSREITKGIDALENPAIHLASVKFDLMVNELYEGVRFE